MSGTKPLIFVRPLSESLSKLHDIIAETAQEDGIEIYDVDDITEVNQLLPSIGQSLTIFSNAKKCAAILQTNKRAIQKLNSKVILLSNNVIPRKTLDKFSKIGLTECVVEPVPPKTLLYKVKLLLRSIATKNEEDEKESERKFSTNSDESHEDSNQRQRVEKGVTSSNENVIDLNLKGKIGTNLDLDSENENDSISSYQEDEINTNWEGSLNDTNLAIASEDNKKKRSAEDSESYIDAYMRNKKSQSSDLEFTDDEDESPQKNKNLNDDINADQLQKKSSKDILSLDISGNKKNKDSQEDEDLDDKYYKGKVGAGLSLDFEEDDADQNNTTKEVNDTDTDEAEDYKNDILMDLELAQDTLSKEKVSLTEDEENKRKKQNNLELSPETDEVRKKKGLEELIEIEKKTKNKRSESEDLENEDNDNDNEFENSSLNLENEEDSERKNDTNNDNIEKYIKGKLSHSNLIIDNEEVDARNANDLDADNEERNDRHSDSLGLALEADDSESDSKSNELTLNLEKERKERNKKSADEESDDYARTSRNQTSLELESETEDIYGLEDRKKAKEERLETERADSLDLKIAQEDLDDELRSKDIGESDQYKRAKASKELDLEADESSRKRSAHTEHIVTNLDSRKSLKHQEFDWDINKNKENSENYEVEKKKKSQIEISFKQKVDLGEQTIDYRKLHSEFEAITITRAGDKKKKLGPTYTSADADKEFLKGVYNDEFLEASDTILDANDPNKVNARKETIYEPKSNGLEVAIRVLNLYYDKKLIKGDLFSYVSTALVEKYTANTYLYQFNKQKNEFERCYPVDNSSNNMSLMDQKFDEIYLLKKEIWRDLNLPTWDNEKFNTPENYFFYPFYEGANKLGFAICLFSNTFDGKSAKSVEVILESLRGIFLDEFHKSGNSEKYDIKLVNEKKASESSGIIGFFSKLFGRAS